MKKFASIIYLLCLVVFPIMVALVTDDWIVRTIAIVVGLLGVLIYFREFYRMSKIEDYDGVLEIWEEDVRMIHRIEILTSPEVLSKQSRVVFVVKKVALMAPDEEIPSDR